MSRPSLSDLENHSDFIQRHIGPTVEQQQEMAQVLGYDTLEALIDDTVPAAIRRQEPMDLAGAMTEKAVIERLKSLAQQNIVNKSFIGTGYHDTLTPAVIQRNVLENPGWYTAYTPYQPEISQGRLEALLSFQQMVMDLTGMELANASMLDESTAAAEAMTLLQRVNKKNRSNVFIVAQDCHPQTIAVVKTRAQLLDIEVLVGNPETLLDGTEAFGMLLQYPGTHGNLINTAPLIEKAHAAKTLVTVAADIMALLLVKSPGELGADVVVGNTQRFGVPMGFGGPHAAYFATRESYKRSTPGRIIGVSIDRRGNQALRMAMQTREQHIRREKATSNICTAQALLAIMAAFYAMYHGPQGLRGIAERIHRLTAIFAEGMKGLNFSIENRQFFDTVTFDVGSEQQNINARALAAGVNLRVLEDGRLGVSLDETTSAADVENLWRIFSGQEEVPSVAALDMKIEGHPGVPDELLREVSYLQHPLFNDYHSETEMLRYMRYLEDKDIALNRAMIPLGSCTMKLNATSEIIPITWPAFAHIHPLAPAAQRAGYIELDAQLRDWLCQATGYAGISLQPNAGSQGEYAGLLAIKAYHQAKGEAHRTVCLIPASAHGTNPASAQMVGMQVVVVACDEAGNVDMADLAAKCDKHSANVAAMMITYPSTHGVFETQVKDLCALVHQHGGRVYVDGANMNALVGVAAPGHFGGDVSHLNLHKTFCIPHGGGGPGVGPVCVVEDLVPYLPGHVSGGLPVTGGAAAVGAVSAAPLGNAAVLPISWMYCRMMGAGALKRATEIAILNANYVSVQLRDHFPTLYASASGRVAHECILDLRHFKETTGIQAEDVAKRLIDYGFHAPTLSFPVPNTLMVEPTESEDMRELDRFIQAMQSIRQEIAQVEAGVWPKDDNPLVNAPHTAETLTRENWSHAYSRETAAYPLNSLKRGKYWVPVGRVDNVYGDRNLFCSCVPLSAYAEPAEAV